MSVINRTAAPLVLAGTAGPALAGDGRTPPDDLAVWIFLAFCALIVLAQIVPLVSSLRKNRAETTAAPQPEKQSR